jgi:4-hydroxy-4-methyl-2-oxoglutarate aldolase
VTREPSHTDRWGKRKDGLSESARAFALETLRKLDGVAVANAIETFDLRLRNEGFADGSIRCMLSSLPPAVGYAVTARIRTSSPPPVGHLYHDRTDWWNFILSTPPPRFVVVQDVDDRAGLGAFIGDVHANILRALGCVAYATNGSVRDVEAVGSIGFQLFATSVALSHGFAHIVDFGEPIEIGGLPIASGDLLFGDRHGLQSIPPETLGRLPQMAAEVTAKERAVISLCRSAEFSVDKLRQLARSLG